jgi:hypothetical protein
VSGLPEPRRSGGEPTEREWLEGLRYEDKYSAPCACVATCGDDGDIDGDGTCKGLPIVREPLVEIVVVRRDAIDR